MDGISWAGAFIAVGMMVCATWGITSLIRGPRVVHIHHDEEDDE